MTIIEKLFALNVGKIGLKLGPYLKILWSEQFQIKSEFAYVEKGGPKFMLSYYAKQ